MQKCARTSARAESALVCDGARARGSIGRFGEN